MDSNFYEAAHIDKIRCALFCEIAHDEKGGAHASIKGV